MLTQHKSTSGRLRAQVSSTLSPAKEERQVHRAVGPVLPVPTGLQKVKGFLCQLCISPHTARNNSMVCASWAR